MKQTIMSRLEEIYRAIPAGGTDEQVLAEIAWRILAELNLLKIQDAEKVQ